MAAITAAIGISGLGTAGGLGPAEAVAQVFDGGSSWIVMTFQLLSMGFLSPLSIGIDVAAFEGFSGGGSIFFVPWLVPAGGIAAVIATQRYLGGNLRTAHIGTRFMLAGLAGLAFATVVTILAASVRFRFDDDFDTGGRLWAHSASLPGFLVSAVLVGFIAYLLLLPQRGQLLQRVMTAVAGVFEHVLILAVLGSVALLIWALVRGEYDSALVILFALPTVGFMAASMVHFIPTVMSGSEDLTGATGTELMTMFTFPTAAWIIAIIVMLTVMFVSAFRWGLRTRFHAHTAWSWIITTITYLLVGVLFTAANGIYVSVFMAGEGLRASFHSAAWGFIVWLLVGAVVQALASYIMPRLTYRLPAGLVRALGVGLTLPPAFAPATPTPEHDGDRSAAQPVPSVEQTAVMSPVVDSNAHITASAETGPPSTQESWNVAAPEQREAQPMTRKSKVVLFSSLSVLALVAIAWIAHTVVQRTVFSPHHTAEEYLQAVVDGRAEDALAAMGPNVTDELRALATDEVYQAADDRPDRFELGDVHRDGSEATVEATIYQSGKAYPLELGLTKSGTQAVVFSDWSLDNGDLAGRAAYVSGPSQLTVNEVDVDVSPSGQGATENSDDTVSDEVDETVVENLAAEAGQVLLPGTYTFTAPEGSKYLSNGEDLELTITPGEVSATPIEFSQRYTSAFEDDAIAQVEQRLEACLADQTIRIDDCEAASWEDTNWNAMSGMERIWDRAPEIELVPADADAFDTSDVDLTEYSGPVNARVVEGSINLTYEVRDDEDDDWMEREQVYSPFEQDVFEPMEFPVSLDGDEIVIDYSALDEYNPDWLSPEFR